MTPFETVRSAPRALDPTKRVNYTFGMVLGTSEFIQDQQYLVGKNRLHNHLLHGHGAVSGLHVRRHGGAHRLEVQPGIALTPRGQEICVPECMYADLGSWLAENREELFGAFPAEPAELDLGVLLCYRECLVDQVPIMGEPCRSESSIAASRVKETFELRLAVQLPGAAPAGVSALDKAMLRDANSAAYRFAQLFRAIVVAQPDAGDPDPMETVVDLVRSLDTHPDDGAPQIPGQIKVPNRGEAEEILEAALRVWVTEVRPKILGYPEGGAAPGTGTVCEPHGADCVLLATVKVRVAAGEIDGDIVVDTSNRPYLLETGVLQELVSAGALREAVAPGPGAPPVVPTHGELNGLNEDHHPHYLLADGTRPVGGSLTVEGNVRLSNGSRVVGLPAADAAGQAVEFNQFTGALQDVLRADSAAGGDASGTLGDLRVTRIHRRPVADEVPTNGSVLGWEGGPNGGWRPRRISGFVSVPEAVPYRVVAAGYFVARAAGGGLPPSWEASGPVVGGLSVRMPRRPGDTLSLDFPAYVQPVGNNAAHAYIVKATPVMTDRIDSPISLVVTEFANRLIRLRIVAGVSEVQPGDIRSRPQPELPGVLQPQPQPQPQPRLNLGGRQPIDLANLNLAVFRPPIPTVINGVMIEIAQVGAA